MLKRLGSGVFLTLMYLKVNGFNKFFTMSGLDFLRSVPHVAVKLVGRRCVRNGVVRLVVEE